MMDSSHNWYHMTAIQRRNRFIFGKVLTEENVDGYALFYGKSAPPNPLRIGVFTGTRAGDFIQTGLMEIKCVSNRTVDCLREHGITGYELYPVEVSDRKGVIIPGYHGLAVTGRMGKLIASRSRIVEGEPLIPGGCPRKVRIGMELDDSKWDGSDICTLTGTCYVWVNEKVVQAVSSCSLTNMECVRVDLNEWDEESLSWYKSIMIW